MVPVTALVCFETLFAMAVVYLPFLSRTSVYCLYALVFALTVASERTSYATRIISLCVADRVLEHTMCDLDEFLFSTVIFILVWVVSNTFVMSVETP